MLMASLWRRRASSAALVAACSCLAPRVAFAQDAENVAAARSLGIQGVQLADAGKCDQAIEKLSRAEALHHAPTILGRLGECQVNVGQIVLGTENLNSVVREQLAANAPKAFRDAQARAQKALDAALPRIAHLTVVIEPHGTQAEVTIGGTPVPPALIGAERPTDPGTWDVEASAPGFLPAKAPVTLAEAGHQTVTLTLSPDPNAVKAAEPPPAPPPPPPPAPPPPAESGSSGMRTLSYVLMGVGGVGIIAGSVTGMMAISKKGGLDCPQNRCSGGEADELDSAKTMATISTISYGVGLPALAVGVVLFVTSGSKQDTGLDTPKGFHARPYVGMRSAGLVGSF